MKHRVKQILFVQGGGAGVLDRWDDRLVVSLRRELGSSYEVHYPRMPEEAEPHHSAWKRKIEDELARFGEDPVLVVAHSIGATIFIHALAEAREQWGIAGVFLIATPFVGEGGWPSDETDPGEGLGARLPRDVPLFFYHGGADPTAPAEHLALYAKAIPTAVTRLVKKRDHQLDDALSEVAADIRRMR